MNKYVLRGAVIGGIWGLVGVFFMIATFLSDIGYARFFAKASIIQWIILFPSMLGAFLDYQGVFKALLGFSSPIFPLMFIIIVGVIIGILLGYLYGKLKKSHKVESL